MRRMTLFSFVALGALGCSDREPGAGPQEPSALALSVRTSPDPILFSLLPPRVPPGDPPPPCCQTLMAHWSIELRAGSEGRLESISGVLRSGSAEFGRTTLSPPWQGPIRLGPGGSVVLAHSLLATLPASPPDSFYVRIHLEIRRDDGSRLERDLDLPLARSGS